MYDPEFKHLVPRLKIQLIKSIALGNVVVVFISMEKRILFHVD